MTAEPEAVALDDLTSWVDTYQAAQAKVKEFEQLAKVARKQIEARLGDAEVGTVAGQPVIRWSTVSSSRVDVTKLKAEYPDLADAVTVTNITRRFTLVKGDEQ